MTPPALDLTPWSASRLPDWPDRLIAYLADERARPFVWGASDCITLWAGAVAAMTGVDPVARWRGYCSMAHGLRMMRHDGLASVRDYVAARFPEIPVAAAGRGDLVYPDAAGVSEIMGPAVVVGAEAISRGEAGVVVMPMAHAMRAFRV